MTKALLDITGYFLTSGGAKSHFTKWEMSCRDSCGKFDMAQSLIDSLEALRLHINEPILITSGVRCYRHNKAVGGEPRSWHMPRLEGDPLDILHQDEPGGMTYAVDISCRHLSPIQLLRETKYPEFINKFRGRGLYRSWVHLDTRPLPAPNAEWAG
jgi:hypothetical protein